MKDFGDFTGELNSTLGLSGSTVYITSFSLDMKQKFTSSSLAYGTVYTASLEGHIRDPAFDPTTYSQNIFDKIAAALEGAGSAGFESWKIKSLTFPNSRDTKENNMQLGKFNASIELHQVAADNNQALRDKAGGYFDTANGELVPIALEANEHVIEYSDNINFDESENGDGKFTHSINVSIHQTQKANISTLMTYLKGNVSALIGAALTYTAMKDIHDLFSSELFVFDNSFDEFFVDFNGVDAPFITSESFDIAANSYSLVRVLNYYKNYDASGASFSHVYTLNLEGEGIVSVTEETKIKGKNWGAVEALLNGDIDGADSSITRSSEFSIDSTILKTKSYARCNSFLNTYYVFLARTSAQIAGNTYITDLTSSTARASLKPVPIERVLVKNIDGAGAVLRVKYSNNPKIFGGAEIEETIKIQKKESIVTAEHTINLKSLKSRKDEFSSFSGDLGTVTPSSIEGFTNGTTKKQESFATIQSLVQSTSTLGNSYVSFRGSFSSGTDASNCAMAMIRKTASRSGRGRRFSVSFSYSSENRYAPLFYQQSQDYAVGDKYAMFNKLNVPNSAADHIAGNFTEFNRVAKITYPTTKFTERIVLRTTPDVAIFDPSQQNTFGRISAVFTGKVKRLTYDSSIPGAYIGYVKGKVAGIFGGSLQSIFQAVVLNEINSTPYATASPTHVIGVAVPDGISYKMDSDFNITVSIGAKYYVYSPTAHAPIFGKLGN